LLIALIVLFSFLLKIFFYSLEPVVSTDGCLYLFLVREWYDTGSYEAMVQNMPGAGWLPPLPVFLIKSLMFFGMSEETAGLCGVFSLGAALSVIAYGIAYEVTQNKKIAVAAALLFALHPSVNEIGTEIQRDIFYLFFAGCSIWFACIAIRRKKWYWWAVAAIPCGASLLCRFETFELLPLVIFILLLLAVMKRISWCKAMTSCVAFFVTLVIAVLLLASVMGTNDFLKESYSKYFAGKWNKVFPQWRIKI
jgi:4-amino-4-deoxy-L-arabinose transferase-like glycosyltransferase